MKEDQNNVGRCDKHGRIMLHDGPCKECRKMLANQNNWIDWIVGFRKEFACDCGEEDCLKLEHQDERIISWIKSNMVSKVELREMLNRCRTEKGLGLALARKLNEN